MGRCWFDELADAATFCAALMPHGIAFTMRPDGRRWLVEMTGC